MKNFYKVRGKREFLFDDKELYALGGLSLIILVLVFSLGVMVGQGLQEESVASPLVLGSDFSGEEFADPEQAEMTEQTGESSDPETQNPPSNTSAEKTMQRSYYQVLPDSETYVEVEATPAKQTSSESGATEQPQKAEVAQAKATPARPVKEETPIPPPGQASAVPQPTQPAANVIPALPNVPKEPGEDIRRGRQPAMTGNAEPIPDGTIYSVQVASSTNREDSERLVQKYGAHGFQAYVMTADLGDKGIWYRVRVGNMPSRETAEQLKQEILNKAPDLANGPYVIKVE